MTIRDYRKKAAQLNFEELPLALCGHEPSLYSFVDIDSASKDLKIHLCELMFNRNFPATGGIVLIAEPEWFIRHFFENYSGDIQSPLRSGSIKAAAKAILNSEDRNSALFATYFMFGIVEFYCKRLLGWEPDKYNFHDKAAHSTYRKMTLNDAFNKIKRGKTNLARSINRIDRAVVEQYSDLKISENDWIRYKMVDRLTLARNTMLHGEGNYFSSKGHYLLLIYILFWLHEN
jgi:hypothetical protein